MNRSLILPLFALAACVPSFQQGAPVLHDVALYSAERGALYGYFYGEPAELSIGGRVVELTSGASDAPLDVPAALLVDGQPYLEQSVNPLGAAPVVVERIPYSTDLSVTAREAVDGTVYFDGEQWFTLLGRVQRGFSSRVIPTGRSGGLYGLGNLTRAEAEVFGRELEAGGPVVVSVLTESRDRTRQANGLGGYLNTALAVQRGTPMTATPTPPSPSPAAAPDWEVLATGSQAAGGDSASFELATSQNDLQNLWSRAYGTMTSPPPLPSVDFSGSSVAAVFLGTRSSGGYSVDVQNVAVENGEMYLDVAVTEPAPGTMTTQALTNPWVMVRVDAPNLGSAWFRSVSSGELLGTARSTLGK